MSLAADLRLARDEALKSAADAADILAALCLLNRKIEALSAQERNQAWACGRRGDGAAKVAGLTDTLTALLRRFAACGMVRYEDAPDLHRQASALRKWCKTAAPTIKIKTIIGEGYEIVQGFDEVYRLLNRGKTRDLRAPGFTVKQTAILQLLSLRGSAHVEQIPCLQRHMSNIRAKLNTLGLAQQIVIQTHGGEGLYTIEKGRDVLERLVSGEPFLIASKLKREPKQNQAMSLAA